MNGSEEKLKFLLANAHLLAIQWGKKKKVSEKRKTSTLA